MRPANVLLVSLFLLVVLPHDALAWKSSLNKAKEKEIDAVFEPWNRTDSPGCSFSLARDGEVLYARGFGMAHLEHPAAITPDTIFEAGSVSKQFTAAAVVILALDGKLSLDDPVRKYLPEVPDFGTPITIRQMLNHTSGLRTFRALVRLRGRPDGLAVHTNSEILELVKQQKDLNFGPGEEYLYSNNGYILAALLAERVSGRSLQDFTDDRIFAPLGMKDTQWRDDFTEVIPRRATAYETGRSGSAHTNMSFSEVYGNGGLLTSVTDLQLWNRELDSPEVLGRDFVEMMETRGRFNDGTLSDYALGLEIGDYRGMRQIAHSGGTAGYRAYLARYPDNDRLSIALLCNDGDLNPVRLSYQALNAFLGNENDDAGEAVSAVPPAASTPSLAELSPLVGVYRHTTSDSIARVSLDSGKLLLGAQELIPLGEDRFRIEALRLEIEFEQDRIAETAKMILANDPKREYMLMKSERLTPADLAEFAGSYRSDELDVAYSIYLQNGDLMFKGPFQQPIGLEPLFADTFEIRDPLLERFPLRSRFALTVAWRAAFERDEAGVVTDLFISEGTRVRRLHFERR